MGEVIIVDDSKMMRTRLRETIESFGHKVLAEARNGKEGVAIYDAMRPDIVSLDISMPEQNGIQALEQILHIDKEAKVVIVSALGQKNMVIKALGMGAKGFIVKPFETEKIREVFNRVLGQ